MSTLLESLKVLQVQERVTGKAMAARLDISGAQWSRLLSGEREFTRKTLRHVLLLWPEMEGEVLEYLKNGG